MIADELGLDGNLARRAGLLHDIGKAMDHDQEGGHPQLGKEFLRRFDEPEAVLNAAEGHHGDVPPTTPYTPFVMAADAISASRPGAPREPGTICEAPAGTGGFGDDVRGGSPSVRDSGRAGSAGDRGCQADRRPISAKIARDIAQKIETELNYPGEIKVTLIREVRSVEYAR